MSSSGELEPPKLQRIEVPADWSRHNNYGVFKCGHPMVEGNFRERIVHGILKGRSCLECNPVSSTPVREFLTIEQAVQKRILEGVPFRCGHPLTIENAFWKEGTSKDRGIKRRLCCKTCQEAIDNPSPEQEDPNFPCGHSKAEHGKLYGKKQPHLMCQICNKARSIKYQRENRQPKTHCHKGHELTGDNVLARGKRRFCVKCLAERSAKYSRKFSVTRVDPRGLNLCKRGHKRTPENIYISPDGHEHCRKCVAAGQKRRNFAKQHNLEYEYKIAPRHLTFEERIVFYSHEEGECLIWHGTFNTNGRPDLAYGKIKHLAVQRYLWQQMNPGNIGPDMVIQNSCQRKECIRKEHLRLIPRAEMARNPASHEKARRARRRSIGSTRLQMLIPALEFLPKIRSSLTRRYAHVAQRDVDDIIQEILVDLYLAGADGKKPSDYDSLEAIVMTIANNAAIDWFRLNRNQTVVMDSLNEVSSRHRSDLDRREKQDFLVADEQADPAVWWEEAEMEQVKRRRLLGRLRLASPRARKAFRLQLEHDFSQQEISASMGISENTVEQHLQKARKLIMPKRGHLKLVS